MYLPTNAKTSGSPRGPAALNSTPRVSRPPLSSSMNRSVLKDILLDRSFVEDYAATTLIRPVFRDRGFRRITISTSWSTAVSRFIKRSTEKPASL